ncbi:hypothetical protein V8F33_005414 [Rhypophila sp. PSN 637]
MIILDLLVLVGPLGEASRSLSTSRKIDAPGMEVAFILKLRPRCLLGAEYQMGVEPVVPDGRYAARSLTLLVFF